MNTPKSSTPFPTLNLLKTPTLQLIENTVTVEVTDINPRLEIIDHRTKLGLMGLPSSTFSYIHDFEAKTDLLRPSKITNNIDFSYFFGKAPVQAIGPFIGHWKGAVPPSLAASCALLLGIDAEYLLLPDGKNNYVLLWQYCLVDLKDRTEYFGAFITHGRPKLANFLQACLLHSGIKPEKYGGRTKNEAKLLITLSHWTPAEYLLFSDRGSDKHPMDRVHKSIITFKPSLLTLTDHHHNQRQVWFLFRDTLLLASEKSNKLEEIAEAAGSYKIEIDKEYYEKMDELLLDDPQLFLEYGMQDTRAVVRSFALEMENYEKDGITKPPVTLCSGAADSLIRDIERETGMAIEVLVGKERVVVNTNKGKRKAWKLTPKLSDNWQLVVDSFHGGYNVAYARGELKAPPGTIFVDFDYSSAYPCIMSQLPAIDFNRHLPIGEERSFSDACNMANGDLMQYAFFRVDRFSFPDTCYTPCFGVDTMNGLLFPREGHDVVVSLPEYAMALDMGAEIQLNSEAYCRFDPLLQNGQPFYLFQPWLLKMAGRRRQFAKGTFENYSAKNKMNGVYGKVGQGLKRVPLRDFRGKSDFMKPGRLTCPPFAANITSHCRIALIAAVNIALDLGWQPLYATTDGFCACVPDPGYSLTDENGKYNPVSELFPDFYSALSSNRFTHSLIQGSLVLGNTECLEIKAHGNECWVGKTRMYGIRQDGQWISNARGGHKLEIEDLYGIYEMGGSPTYLKRQLVSPFDVLNPDMPDIVDLVPNNKDVHSNTDWDGKRVLNEDGWSSRPIINVEEFEERRECIDRLHKAGLPCEESGVDREINGFHRVKGTRKSLATGVLRQLFTKGSAWKLGNKINLVTHLYPTSLIEQVFNVPRSLIKNCRDTVGKTTDPTISDAQRFSRKVKYFSDSELLRTLVREWMDGLGISPELEESCVQPLVDPC